MEKCIAIYLRVSLEDYDLKHSAGKDESNSIFAQRKLVESYIKREPTLVGSPAVEYVDDGYTGTNFERPGFQSMLEQVKAGSITCVIVKDLSRLGRNYLEVGNYVEHLFPFLGVRFIAINDYYDSSENNGTNAGIDLAFKNILHDCYSRDLSVKVRSAQRTRMERGKYVNTPPYGYRCDPKDKHHLIPDPVTAKVVQTIFKMKINGSSTSEIAAYLNQNQIPTPLEAKGVKRREGLLLMWSHQAVLRILNCYKYTGAMVNHTRENQKLRDRNQKRRFRSCGKAWNPDYRRGAGGDLPLRKCPALPCQGYSEVSLRQVRLPAASRLRHAAACEPLSGPDRTLFVFQTG